MGVSVLLGLLSSIYRADSLSYSGDAAAAAVIDGYDALEQMSR